MLTHSPACCHDPDARNDSGMGVIELVVVLLIISIVMGAAGWGMLSQRKAARGELAVATARAYADAVVSYAADHNGRVPTSIGGTGWAVPKDGPASPLARAAFNGRYLRNIPEAVQDGHIGVGSMGSAGYFTYQSAGATGWTIRVFDTKNVLVCYTGTTVIAGTRKCRDID